MFYKKTRIQKMLISGSLILFFCLSAQICFARTTKSTRSQESFQFNLNAGWNLISLPIAAPYKASNLFKLSPKFAWIIYYWDTTAQIYKTLSQDDYLETGKSYWVYVTGTQAITITITGEPITNRTVSLKRGWNLIGWPATKELTIRGGLWPLVKGPDYNILWCYETSGRFEIPTVFKPGKGYWIYMIRDAVLTFPLEFTPPIGTVKINNDSTYSNSTSVTLNLNAQDEGGSGVAKMSFSNDNTNWSVEENYSTTKNWNLISGDGLKTVWAKFADGCGNKSITEIKDTVILDTTPAAISITSPLDGAIVTDR